MMLAHFDQLAYCGSQYFSLNCVQWLVDYGHTILFSYLYTCFVGHYGTRMIAHLDQLVCSDLPYFSHIRVRDDPSKQAIPRLESFELEPLDTNQTSKAGLPRIVSFVSSSQQPLVQETIRPSTQAPQPHTSHSARTLPDAMPLARGAILYRQKKKKEIIFLVCVFIYDKRLEMSDVDDSKKLW